jgi:hypothetical protein
MTEPTRTDVVGHLLEIKKDVGTISGTITEMSKKLDSAVETQGRQGKRIGKLENGRWYARGGIAVIASMLGLDKFL